VSNSGTSKRTNRRRNNRSTSRKQTLIPSGNPRLDALAAIATVLDDRRNLPTEFARHESADPRDRALSRHLAFSVIRWLIAVEWLAAQLLQRPLKKKDQDVHRLILLGLTQLWHDRAASHAVVNETAECARTIGKPWAVGVINAILRRFQREREHWLDKLSQTPEQWAHPVWLLNTLQKDWPEDWQAIARANNEQPPMWLRINRGADLRGEHDRPGKVIETISEAVTGPLEEAGFSLVGHPHAPEAIRVEPAAPVESIPGFGQGRLSVQDAAAQLAVHLMDVAPGQNVLDACAAPGGKTCHILETCPEIRLTAVDADASRLEMIRANLKRIRPKNAGEVQLVAADAADTQAWWDGVLFDRILLDAPCSATGVIRRHPEIRHLRQRESIVTSTATQAELLRKLWPLLKPGGMLVYATCSVLDAENSVQITDFLQNRTGAQEVPIDSGWGMPTRHGRQILPGQDKMDGFYYARIRKID
jgi:16S rRNA (cytosine967-C5)-methyltransferase